MKSITLHAHAGPNPWKVAIILEELSLPYTTKVWATADQKKPPFTTTLNPNGFTPVIEDPNTGVMIWEPSLSTRHLLSPSTHPVHAAQLLQWQFFQCTFQGPNMSIAFYFSRTNPNPEARKRFVDESLRVLEVLEGALEGNGESKGEKWLVGNKCTAADLVFYPYLHRIKNILGADAPNLATDFPNVNAWFVRMGERESVKKVLATWTEASAAAFAALAPPAAAAGAGK